MDQCIAGPYTYHPPCMHQIMQEHTSSNKIDRENRQKGRDPYMNTYPFRNERVRCPGSDIAGWGLQRIDPLLFLKVLDSTSGRSLVCKLAMEAPLQTHFHQIITSTNDTKINPLKNHFQNLSLLKSHRKSEK